MVSAAGSCSIRYSTVLSWWSKDVFMETARLEENSLWMKELCKLIDWTADHCDWEEGMPHLFGALLEEMLRQMYAWGTTGLFLMPENLTRL